MNMNTPMNSARISIYKSRANLIEFEVKKISNIRFNMLNCCEFMN